MTNLYIRDKNQYIILLLWSVVKWTEHEEELGKKMLVIWYLDLSKSKQQKTKIR